jgi:hypothetical protein
MKQFIKNFLKIFLSIFSITWIFLFITVLSINFDHDYVVIRRENEMDFDIVYITTMFFLVYILIVYLYKKQTVKVSLYFMYFMYLWLLNEMRVDLHYYPNETTYYYLYYYLCLFAVHTMFVIAITLRFLKNYNKAIENTSDNK